MVKFAGLDFAEYMLERLRAAGLQTDLVNFYLCTIASCQKCAYECVQKFDPEKGINAPCPIKDDVRSDEKSVSCIFYAERWVPKRRLPGD